MEFRCVDAKIGSGPAGSGLVGTLTINGDGVTFVPNGDPAKPLHWDLPGAKQPSTILRVLAIGPSVVLHLGPLDDFTAINLPCTSEVDVNRTLAAHGVPAGISAMTRAALHLRSLRGWAPFFVLLGLLPADDATLNTARLMILGVGLGSLIASHRLELCLVSAAGLAVAAAYRFATEGVSFWAVALTFIACQEISIWRGARAHLAVPENAAWLHGVLAQLHTDVARPIGWFSRGVALLLAGWLFVTIAPLILVLPLVAFKQPFALVHVLVYMLGVLWYLAVCFAPATMNGVARRIAPTGGGLMLILIPWIMHNLVYELAIHAGKLLVALQKL